MLRKDVYIFSVSIICLRLVVEAIAELLTRYDIQAAQFDHRHPQYI